MSIEGIKSHEQLADELFALQKEENDGRGIGCVRAIAHYWKIGDLESARAGACNENDKIRNYPHIQQWLEDNLFGPSIDSPIKSSKRIKAMLERDNS